MIDDIPEILSKSLSTKTRLSVFDFKLELKKQLKEARTHYYRKSQPNLSIVKKNAEKQSSKEEVDDRLPFISKFQTLEINVSEKENERKKKQAGKPKQKVILKKLKSMKREQKEEEQCKEEQKHELPNKTNQRPFYIHNLGLKDIEVESKKNMMANILSKIKDIERRKKGSFVNVTKKSQKTPEELKANTLRYKKIEKEERNGFGDARRFLGHRSQKCHIVKEQNVVSGWNVRNSNESMQTFYQIK